MSIFRLRPACDYTLDELSNEYLWFSLPCGFKDKDRDANISAFIRHNNGLRIPLSKVLNNIGLSELAEKSKNIGICCFTHTLPDSRKIWREFPNGLDSICIEYDEKKLSSFL